MVRTPVNTKDILPLLITALNGTTVNGGTLSAVLQPGGQEIKIITHFDGGANPGQQYTLRLM